MIVVLAIDALEYNLVEKFNCIHLKQKYYGKTDISEFSEPRTIVLWTSFMTGKNTEKVILSKGMEKLWDTAIEKDETFVAQFRNPAVIDLPGYSYDTKQHEAERDMLRRYFDASDEDERKEIRAAYNNGAIEHHKRIKDQFNEALKGDHDLIIGYFSVLDVIGHLSFGEESLIKMLYREMDEIASNVKSPMIVLSDHGMKRIGSFGDHSDYGFWSTRDENLMNPKITDFFSIIVNMKEGDPFGH